MKIQNITGIVIRKRLFTENDQIITILSDAGYRVELIAKGLNTPRSKRRSHIELMNLIKGTIYHSKSKIYLQSVECQSSFLNLKEKLEFSLKMHTILEIIEKTIMEEDKHKEIYNLLLQTLHSLNMPNPHEFTPEAMQIKLAHLLGFLPSFKECANCHKNINEDNAKWDKLSGTLHCKKCAKTDTQILPLKYRKAFEFFKFASTSEIEKININQKETKMMQELIPSFFTSHIDKPLKSLLSL